MTTYSIRCRVASCRHRRVVETHPDDYKRIPKCPMCGSKSGWRIENRAYNKVALCGCGQSPTYPHRKGKYKYCDYHPQGFYNQAKRKGISDDEIPIEYLGRVVGPGEGCPF